MDKVFKALADPVRRGILDRLLETEGATLAQLCEGREMTRFGVMKHLGVLEQANLVVCRRVGRRKLHYLNAAPIGMIQDRWLGRYAESIAAPAAAHRPRSQAEGEAKNVGPARKDTVKGHER
jgi:DNA-binding transcriptional ArsR family regulator